MEKLAFNTGIKEMDCGFGVPLRVNFADPNFYERFGHMTQRITDIEKQMAERSKTKNITDGNDVLRILRETDLEVKSIMNETFGLGNDFDKIMGGMNIMAVCEDTGERIVTGFLNAITPLVHNGFEAFAHGKVEEAKMNREQRRASQRAGK